jgi:hypothetical protein
VLLFAGTRKSDMVRLGPQHVVNGWIRYVPRKTRHVNPDASEKPLLSVLAEVITASPRGPDAFLVAEKTGQPYTANGLGNAMRQWCDAAGFAGMHLARPQESRGGARGRKPRDRISNDGAFRLAQPGYGAGVYQQGEQEKCAAQGKCH